MGVGGKSNTIRDKSQGSLTVLVRETISKLLAQFLKKQVLNNKVRKNVKCRLPI